MEIADIPVEVIRKPIKNLHLYVKPPWGDVLVTAPLKTADKAIESFVCDNLAWLKEQRQRVRARTPTLRRSYASGEILWLWGKAYPLEVQVGEERPSLKFAAGRAYLIAPPDSTQKEREAIVREAYRDILKQEVAHRLPRWELVTGLYADEWRTKYMKTRWGTCNVTERRIWLNIQLAERPLVCLEYVILHELVHLAERGHGPRFKALMDKYMKSWREIKKLLNAAL